MGSGEYPHINLSESIGTSFNIILKGAAQVGAQTLNATLSPSNGLVQILATGFVIGVLVFIVERLTMGKRVFKQFVN